MVSLVPNFCKDPRSDKGIQVRVSCRWERGDREPRERKKF